MTVLHVAIDAVIPILLRECYACLAKGRKKDAKAVVAAIVRVIRQYVPSQDTIDQLYELGAGFPECAPELALLMRRAGTPEIKKMFEEHHRAMEISHAVIAHHMLHRSTA